MCLNQQYELMPLYTLECGPLIHYLILSVSPHRSIGGHTGGASTLRDVPGHHEKLLPLELKTTHAFFLPIFLCFFLKFSEYS